MMIMIFEVLISVEKLELNNLFIFTKQDMVDKLKSQMEAARKAAETQKASGIAPVVREQGQKPAEGEDFVVLTRTDRSGVARPVPDRQHPQEAKGGRRKKQKVGLPLKV